MEKSTCVPQGDRKVVVLEGVRTPFHYQGETGVIDRNKIKKETIDLCIFGSMIQEPNNINIGRDALVHAGFKNTPALTLSSGCASSISATFSAFYNIKAGSSDTVLVGGVDLTSDIPLYLNKIGRKAMLKYRLDKPTIKNYRTNRSMYEDAQELSLVISETIPNLYQKLVDEVSSSYASAVEARKLSFLTDIIPFRCSDGTSIEQDQFDDETATLRYNNSRELAFKNKIPIYNWFQPHDPADRENMGPHQKHNYLTQYMVAPFADGASATILMSEEKAIEEGLTPKAVICDIAVTSNDLYKFPLYGVVSSIKQLLFKNSLTFEDISLYEIHEATCVSFNKPEHLLNLTTILGSQDLISRSFSHFPQINSWGGSFAFGHPFAATGVRLINMASNRLHKLDGARYAIVSSTAGGGL
ncbi:hypothetical protein MXB_4457, partial [Myxobolus squamalis]